MSLRTSPQPQFDPTSLSVLVADDHDYMRTILTEVLRGIGVGRIYSAGSGEEALEIIELHEPNVLITDWCMDGMDGNELVRAIRASEWASRDMPVIMMSGDTRRRQIDGARDYGADEFVAKPVSGQKIIARLREVCRRPRSFVESMSYIGPCRRRQKLPFKGPHRRLSDPTEVVTPTAELKHEQQRAVAACITHVHEMALHLPANNRATVRAMYSNVCEADASAVDSADLHLLRATRSLMRYLQGVGATGHLQADVIATHLDAILAIIALPASALAEREALAEGLENVVSKKLRPQPAAA